MSSRSGRRSRSRSRSREPRKSSRKDRDRPWLRKSRSRSRSNSSSSSSRSRSSRRKNRRSHSRSKSPVRPVMSKDPKYVNARVFVANFASDKANSSDLQRIFKKHGKIVDILVHHNGYGFVQFALEEDARRAIEAETGTIFHGKSLKCNMAAEGKKENDDGQKGGEKGRDRGGGFAPDGGMGRGGPAFPPRDDRFGRDNRDPYGPPLIGDPYMRGRELSPLSRDYRGLPPPPFGRDPRGYGDLPPDYLPLRGYRDPRDLPPPPRDPIFDDPYRRPPPPDLYFDRYRDDPYRRDPYRIDPFRDPLRDPYGASLLDPVPAPKKSMAVDCDIIIMSAELRRYADTVEKSLKNMNLLTNLTVLREDQTIQQRVEDAVRHSCLFAITINSQNEFHHSLSVNILHGTPQEHRNMPLKDAIELVGRSFEKFLTAEKEKLAAKTKEKTSEESGRDGEGQMKGREGPPHPKDVDFLLKLLVDNQPLSTEELDRLIDYLQEKKDKALGIVQKPQSMERDETARSPGLQQPRPQGSSQLSTPPPQPKQQSPQYQQQQPPLYQKQQQQPQYAQQRERSPSYQQQQQLPPSYRRQQSPPYQWSQEEPQYRQQQPQNQHLHQQEPLYQQPQQSEKPQQQPQYPKTQQQPPQYQQPQQQQYPQTQQPEHQYPQQAGNRSQQLYQQTPSQSLYQQEQQQQQSPSTGPQDIQTKIMTIMNGGSSTAASTVNSLPQNTLPSHTSSLLTATLAARPPPPPPPPQESPSDSTPSAMGRGVASLGSSQMLSSPVAGMQSSGAAPHGSYQSASSLPAGPGPRGGGDGGGALGSYIAVSSSASAAAQKGVTSLPSAQGGSSSSSAPVVGGIPATLINFDNPTVQKALDNLIQSGSSLLKNIQATTGQNTSLATSQQTGGFRGAGRPLQPPF